MRRSLGLVPFLILACGREAASPSDSPIPALSAVAEETTTPTTDPAPNTAQSPTLTMARGGRHQAALRALAFKWIRIHFRCWKDRVAYDESRYLAALEKRVATSARSLAVHLRA